MTVTATARISVPNGSPTLAADHLGVVDGGEHGTGQHQPDQGGGEQTGRSRFQVAASTTSPSTGAATDQAGFFGGAAMGPG